MMCNGGTRKPLNIPIRVSRNPHPSYVDKSDRHPKKLSRKAIEE